MTLTTQQEENKQPNKNEQKIWIDKLHQKRYRVANKHMKRLTLLVIRKIQIKTTVSCC